MRNQYKSSFWAYWWCKRHQIFTAQLGKSSRQFVNSLRSAGYEDLRVIVLEFGIRYVKWLRTCPWFGQPLAFVIVCLCETFGWCSDSGLSVEVDIFTIFRSKWVGAWKACQKSEHELITETAKAFGVSRDLWTLCERQFRSSYQAGWVWRRRRKGHSYLCRFTESLSPLKRYDDSVRCIDSICLVRASVMMIMMMMIWR